MKHSALRFLQCDLPTFHPYYIYPHYPQKYVRPFREKNLRQVFYNTCTHLLERERESYSSLVRNHCSLFSFPIPLSYLERRFVPNTTHTFLEYRECFGAWEALGICQKKPMRLGRCNRTYCRIQKDREDITQRRPLVVGVQRAQVH